MEHYVNSTQAVNVLKLFQGFFMTFFPCCVLKTPTYVYEDPCSLCKGTGRMEMKYKGHTQVYACTMCHGLGMYSRLPTWMVLFLIILVLGFHGPEGHFVQLETVLMADFHCCLTTAVKDLVVD